MSREALRHIPSMDVLLNDSRLQDLVGRFSREEIKMELELVIDEFRSDILAGRTTEYSGLGEGIIERLLRRIDRGGFSSLRSVINGTGVILHTNLGRSLLADQAIKAIEEVSRGYCSLEYDIEQGKRGSRYVHCEGLLKRLTGAEAALVVNNNAAAVTLVLNTFSEGREAIVSRGELVEIGGSFRMPDIMAKSGATMVEVGTTNKTRISDYRHASSERTGVVLKVHRSNFSMAGFVDEATIRELAEFSREISVPFLYDQGSGVLMGLDSFGIMGEHTVRECLQMGASAVCFSGDKLLGGPQAGIIVGAKEVVERTRANPLTRTYRVDKFTLAALGATLRLYLDPDRALRDIPVLRMLTSPCGELEVRGRSIIRSLGKGSSVGVSIEEVSSEVGGGTLPSLSIPSLALSIEMRGGDVNRLERSARGWNPPIIGRISRGRFLLDLRTIQPSDDPAVISCLKACL